MEYYILLQRNCITIVATFCTCVQGAGETAPEALPTSLVSLVKDVLALEAVQGRLTRLIPGMKG